MNFIRVDPFTFVNIDDIRKIRFDNMSDTPAFYLIYKSGITERYSVSSLEEFQTIFSEVF